MENNHEQYEEEYGLQELGACLMWQRGQLHEIIIKVLPGRGEYSAC